MSTWSSWSVDPSPRSTNGSSSSLRWMARGTSMVVMAPNLGSSRATPPALRRRRARLPRPGQRVRRQRVAEGERGRRVHELVACLDHDLDDLEHDDNDHDGSNHDLDADHRSGPTNH